MGTLSQKLKGKLNVEASPIPEKSQREIALDGIVAKFVSFSSARLNEYEVKYDIASKWLAQFNNNNEVAITAFVEAMMKHENKFRYFEFWTKKNGDPGVKIGYLVRNITNAMESERLQECFEITQAVKDVKDDDGNLPIAGNTFDRLVNISRKDPESFPQGDSIEEQAADALTRKDSNGKPVIAWRGSKSIKVTNAAMSVEEMRAVAKRMRDLAAKFSAMGAPTSKVIEGITELDNYANRKEEALKQAAEKPAPSVSRSAAPDTSALGDLAAAAAAIKSNPALMALLQKK
jgi:hypothetical protein